MKSIARIAVLMLSFGCFFSLGAQDKTSFSTNRIDVVFDKNTSVEDLASVKEQLAERNISIKFSNISFTEKGNLKAIEFTVDCKDGFKGNSKIGNLLVDGSNLGFFRDYTEGIADPFGTWTNIK